MSIWRAIASSPQASSSGCISVAPDPKHRNALILGVGIALEQRVLPFVVAVRRIGDDEQRARALAERQLRLRIQRRLRHRPRAVQAAAGIVLLRLVREDEHGLAETSMLA